jgi:hypothetical protein
VQQAHFLLVEEVGLARVEQERARALAAGEQRQRDEGAALRVVPDERARAELEARKVALGAALAGRGDLADRVTWRRISAFSEGLSSTRETPCACASACASCPPKYAV